MILKNDELAKAYAETHPLSIENPGKVWAHYVGGGWITLRGAGLKPHPSMADHCPTGWCLFDRIRSGKARQELRARALDRHFAVDKASFS